MFTTTNLNIKFKPSDRNDRLQTYRSGEQQHVFLKKTMFNGSEGTVKWIDQHKQQVKVRKRVDMVKIMSIPFFIHKMKVVTQILFFLIYSGCPFMNMFEVKLTHTQYSSNIVLFYSTIYF